MSAIAVAGRAAFAPFPQFKPMLAVIVTTAACFGAPSGCLVGVVSAFVSNFIFGQGPLTPWQMFGFGLCGLIAGAVLSGGGIHERLRKTSSVRALSERFWRSCRTAHFLTLLRCSRSTEAKRRFPSLRRRMCPASPLTLYTPFRRLFFCTCCTNRSAISS